VENIFTGKHFKGEFSWNNKVDARHVICTLEQEGRRWSVKGEHDNNMVEEDRSENGKDI